MKKQFDVAAFEVTRRCNMACAHCMRGEAENKDLNLEYVDKFLDGCEFIYSLLITGGEPSLNVPAIRYITKAIKERGIDLSSAAVITNGKEVSDEFILALAELFAATSEPECNYLAVSRDVFHEEVPPENIRKLSIFQAFDPKGHHNDWTRGGLQNLGRAENLDGYEKRDYSGSHAELSYGYDPVEGVIRFDNVVALTVDGEIRSDCDYDYADTAGTAIGHVTDPFWAENAIGVAAAEAKTA